MSTFRLYNNGDVWFEESGVSEPVRFAHVVDLHLPPRSLDAVPRRYHHAINWWNIDSGRPHDRLPRLLDEVRDCGIDFIFFGGDVLDCYDRDTAVGVVELCRQRNLVCQFQFGNHDFEPLHVRYVTHELNLAVRRENGAKLCAHWAMPAPDYAFTHGGVRFVSLDCPYEPHGQVWGGRLGNDQVKWFLSELGHDGPIVVFHHVPFNLPTLEHRLRAIWKGALATLIDDPNTRRVRDAIASHPRVLGTFAGHSHARSEDPIGGPWQYMTADGCHGNWRWVCISPEPAPKSMRVPEEPTVGGL